MGKIIFILGGVKSGKTNYATSQAIRHGGPVTYLATGSAGDKEMKRKIEEHKKMRPKNWETIEEPLDLISRIRKITSKIIVIDCINFWVSNLLASGMSKEKILKKTSVFCSLLLKKKIHTFIISNEVGMSLVPVNKTGRGFQELLGKVNQVIADYADKVYLMVTGIPLKVK
jgi:adenosylcobinamide kinase/adenosylcobinamide-phosphate guanylyltransferase